MSSIRHDLIFSPIDHNQTVWFTLDKKIVILIYDNKSDVVNIVLSNKEAVIEEIMKVNFTL